MDRIWIPYRPYTGSGLPPQITILANLVSAERLPELRVRLRRPALTPSKRFLSPGRSSNGNRSRIEETRGGFYYRFTLCPPERA